MEKDCISINPRYPLKRPESNATWFRIAEIPTLRRYDSLVFFCADVVIYHHGTSATGGHYTADVLLQDGQTWLNLDDTKLKWVDAAQVAVSDNEGSRGDVDHQVNGDGDMVWNNTKSKVAYILLYKRIHY